MRAKSNARLFRGLHVCASLPLDAPAKDCGHTKPQKNLPLALAALFEQPLTKSQVSESHRAALLESLLQKLPGGLWGND